MDVCQPGDVLVVTTTSESTDGMFGELLGVSAKAHGIVGLIIDAGVRDVADLTAMEFPVWSKAISAQGTVKNTAGLRQRPGRLRRRHRPPRRRHRRRRRRSGRRPTGGASEVARLASDRLAKEQKTRERLRSGELGLDFYGLRAKLAEMGVQYVDELKRLGETHVGESWVKSLPPSARAIRRICLPIRRTRTRSSSSRLPRRCGSSARSSMKPSPTSSCFSAAITSRPFRRPVFRRSASSRAARPPRGSPAGRSSCGTIARWPRTS